MPFYLAALGAFITIVALAIDPFSQQIIQYYDCSVLISGAKAIIPTSNFYMGGSYFPNGDAQIPTPQMSAAIYVGLLDPPPNGSSNLLVDCSTGNCTFPETTGASYSSIAMCSSCADISPTIINGTYWDNTYGMIGNYSLPSGPMLLADKPDILNSTIVSEGNDAMGNYSVPRAAPLIIIETLMARTQAQNLATRCSFSPCVNTYGGNITNGILQERLVSSTPLAIYGGGFTQFLPNHQQDTKRWCMARVQLCRSLLHRISDRQCGLCYPFQLLWDRDALSYILSQ